MLEPSEQDLTDPKGPVDQTVTLQFGFHFDSLSIILYNNDSHQVNSIYFLLPEMTPLLLRVFSFCMLALFVLIINKI